MDVNLLVSRLNRKVLTFVVRDSMADAMDALVLLWDGYRLLYTFLLKLLPCLIRRIEAEGILVAGIGLSIPGMWCSFPQTLPGGCLFGRIFCPRVQCSCKFRH